jgi:hypothetical protein
LHNAEFVDGAFIEKECPMTSMRKFLIAVAAGTGALALSSVGASAAIACSGDVCWHTHEHYRYPPDAKVVIHEDNWRAGPHITFHEHEGRGYWRGSAWTTW